MKPPARRAALAAACALAAALAAAGCNVSNAQYCCTTTASCAEGGTGATPCAGGEFCDDLGEYGPARTCVPQPVDRCVSADDCSDPSRPLCVDQRCVACETSAECSPAAPVCDPDTLACVGCDSADDCGAPLALCHPDTGACVECVTFSDCAADEPVCDDGACRTCTADADCASEVCDEGAGTCVDGGRILYVEADAPASTTCTQAAPCPLVATAVGLVSTSRDVIRLRPGSYVEQVSIQGKTLRLAGEGAELRSTIPGPVLLVGGTATVTIDALRVHAGVTSGSVLGDGIRCQGGGPARPALTLRGVTLDANDHRGLDASSCNVTVEAARIADNLGNGIVLVSGVHALADVEVAGNGGNGIDCAMATMTIDRATVVDSNAAGVVTTACPLELRDSRVEGSGGNGISATGGALTVTRTTVVGSGLAGIAAAGGPLTVERSRVANNTGGGLSIGNVGSFTVRNNFIVDNGTTDGAANNVGGVTIDAPGTGPFVFEFNTVAGNTKFSGGLSGVLCSNTTTAVPIANNIVYDNGFGTVVPTQVAGTNCTPSYLLYGPAGTMLLPGTGVTRGDPTFVDAAAGDYHLAAGSLGIGAANPAASLADDFDGDARPQGDGRDLGADEVVP